MSMGANAEYICVPEHGSVALKPANMSYAEAATLPYGAVMAASLPEKARLKAEQKNPGQRRFWRIGALAVQLAKHHYGIEVTGVCGAPRLEYVKALGADKIIDYKKQDFTRNGQQYDLILAVNGYHPISDYLRALNAEGTYVIAGG